MEADRIGLNCDALLRHLGDPAPSPFWVALDLAVVNCLHGAPMVWSPAALAASLECLHPERRVSADWLLERQSEVHGFFVTVDGGYLPDPAWMCLRDPLAMVH